MIEEVEKDARLRMQKGLEVLRNSLSRIRTGRAHPSLLEHLPVNSYGSELPLQQVAKVTSADARTLKVIVWDKQLVPDVEKAIGKSGQGLNPVTAGEVIHVPLPPLSRERRHELVKLARSEAEQGRIALRNVRRDAIRDLRELATEKEIGEDQQRRGEALIQQLTDECVKEVEELLSTKEQDLTDF